MRSLGLACLALVVSAVVVSTQTNPFLGRWDITVTTPRATYPSWLEVKDENGQLVGTFQDRTSAVKELPEIALQGAELVFSPGAPKVGAPKPVHRARLEKGRLVGEMTRGEEKAAWVGVRPPSWGKVSANGAHRFGAPLALFNGRDLAGWKLQSADRPSGWAVSDGLLSNPHPGNNLYTEQRFRDFRLQMEYRLEPTGNSGLYLRGRYELQVLEDAGKEPTPTSHMSVYGRVAPRVNASRPAGEWQAVDVTLVGNRVSVVLNGQTVHDDAVIDGITGGALDSNEAEPGPIMIQGDHSRIWIRKLVITPIQ